MNSFSNLSVSIFLFFSLIFYGIAIFLFGDFLLILNCLFFIIICSLILNFYPPYSKNLIKINVINEDKTFNIILFLLGPTSLFLALILFSPPLLSEKPELDRVIFADRLGVFDRIITTANYFFIIYNVCLFTLDKKNTRIILILLTIILMLLTGFRSRVMDVLFISFLTYSYTRKINLVKTFFSLRILVLGALFFILLVFITKIRTQADIILVILSIFERIFLINYEVNISRILKYTTNNEFMYGYGYINDFKSVFSSTTLSMQQIVTSYFNKINSEIFVMTPTQFGEAYLNFGYFTNVFYPFILFFFTFLIRFFTNLIYLANHKGLLVVFLIYSTYFLVRSAPTLGISSYFITKLIPGFLVATLFMILIYITKK